MQKAACLASLSLLVLLATGSPVQAAGESEKEVVQISIWSRISSPGIPRGRRDRLQHIDLKTLASETRELFDAQLGRKAKYTFVPLGKLIETHAPAATDDLALLHFYNGMIVPLPFRNADVIADLKPVVAIGNFEPLRKDNEGHLDVRPVQFAGNKVVVQKPTHPAIPEAIARDLNPWRHVDSLVGIEFVNDKAYYNQFQVNPGNQSASTGLDLFKQSCQFCHGARKEGAQFGWDFVDPIPAYTWRRKGTHLLYHIKYPRLEGEATGFMMPALRSISAVDAEYLWFWLKAVATEPMPAYEVPRDTRPKKKR
jgi:hypothetical protein